MPIYQKVSGVWTAITDVYRKDTTWKNDIHTVYNRVSGVWRKSFERFFVPVGLILPYYTDGLPPTGWTTWNAGLNHNIIGAGDTYAVGDNSVGSGGLTPGTNLAGGHWGVDFSYNNDAESDGGKYRADSFNANHAHVFNITYIPPANRTPFIKAVTSGMVNLPTRAGAWSVDGLTKAGLNNMYAGDKILLNGLAGDIGADSYPGIISNSVASHVHGVEDSGSGSGDDVGTWAGVHTHTETFGVENLLRRVRMSLWNHLTQGMPFIAWGENVIGMYESLTPPDGWFLCNGSNGTPDLRNHFIINSAYDHADIGVQIGTGGARAYTAGAVAHGTHNHADTNESGDTNREWYHYAGAMPSHAQISSTTATWLPPYYALAFIMKG